MAINSESHHFYDREGNPRYEIENKSKGGMRNTTLRDCKKHLWVPSVTTVMQLENKPGLNKWLLNQVMLAALTLPKIEGESLDDFEKRVWEDANTHAEQARNKGTEIHGVLENYFSGGQVSEKDKPLIESVFDALMEKFGVQQWSAEKSFASPAGYGGKVDLHSDKVVIDFKTKEFTEDDLPKAWPEQKKQLAAYADGLGLVYCSTPLDFPRCANVFISTTVPGLVHIVEHKQKDLEHALKCFLAQLRWWQLEKKYNSSY